MTLAMTNNEQRANRKDLAYRGGNVGEQPCLAAPPAGRRPLCLLELTISDEPCLVRGNDRGVANPCGRDALSSGVNFHLDICRKMDMLSDV